jgi:aminoglycoside phosphotransferase (APT) family kinase protein
MQTRHASCWTAGAAPSRSAVTNWADHDRHRRSRPTEEGLRRLGAALGGEPPHVIRRLGGGLGSATHLLGSGARRLVLKRYPPGSDAPALEWEGLTFAHGAHLPAPEPVALDQDGAWFGSPSLVMVAARGRPDLSPSDRRRYVEEVAFTMASLHATDTTDARGALLRPPSAERWTAPDDVPEGLLSRPLAGRVIETLAARLARADGGATVLHHGDLHPGNLLWHGGRLSAVVDWSSTRLGPRWWEVAYFRMEAAVLLDARAADRLLACYEAEVGADSTDQPVWDLLCLYNGHRWGHLWLRGYQEQGRRDLTLATMRRRLDRLARRALAALTPAP